MDYIVVPPKIVSEPLRSRSLTILYGNNLLMYLIMTMMTIITTTTSTITFWCLRR